MTNVEVVHNVYVRLANRPGTLQEAARALAQHRINIDAISLETNDGVGFARILTHKAKEAVEALRSADLEAFPSEMAIASLPNRAGELERACAELCAGGLNIESVLTTPDGRLAFRTNDVEQAAHILRKL